MNQATDDLRRTKSLKESKTFEVTAELERPSQSINVYISSVGISTGRQLLMLTFEQECVAGVTVTKFYKPDISASQYPTRNTRPQTSLVRSCCLVSSTSTYLSVIGARNPGL